MVCSYPIIPCQENQSAKLQPHYIYYSKKTKFLFILSKTLDNYCLCHHIVNTENIHSFVE